MGFNFVNIQAYKIKLTRKFKYIENLAGAHVTQVDVDACYERGPLKVQVVFVVTITIKVYGCQNLFVCEGEPTNFNDRYAVSVVKDNIIVGHLPRLGAISWICLLFLLSLTRKRAL